MPALFLDRDGVINVRTPGDYVKTVAEFDLIPGVAEAIARLSRHFNPIVVVTNQAGIGKGLMSEADLADIHRHMIALLTQAGGRVDLVLYCPHTPGEGCDCRKPGVGMPLEAARWLGPIDYSAAWMVGDSASDIEMGLALGMHTALIAGKTEETDRLAALPVELRCDRLSEFADKINHHYSSDSKK